MKNGVLVTLILTQEWLENKIGESGDRHRILFIPEVYKRY